MADGLCAALFGEERDFSPPATARTRHRLLPDGLVHGAPDQGGDETGASGRIAARHGRVDETYVGGKPRPEAGAPKAKRGRGTKKIPVVALVERNGRVRAHKIERVDGVTLKGAIRANVDRKARIMTDEWAAYSGIGPEFAGGHQTVNHGSGEYARGDVFTNTAESYFALLKRGVIGSFHHVSKEHLDCYCDEFSFRWNHRSATDSDRTAIALRQSRGKRLTYKTPIRG